MIRAALACLILAGCASRPSVVRFTYYDDHGCAWIQRSGEKPGQLTDTSTGEQFCIREGAK